MRCSLQSMTSCAPCLRRRVCRIAYLLGTFSVLALYGCDRYPSDQRGTLKRISSTKALRVGVIDDPPWVHSTQSGRPTGIEPELVEHFAETLDTKIVWEVGAAHTLFAKLKNTNLDIVIGGLTQDNPWRSQVGFTQPYFIEDDSGDAHVLAVPSGENRFITALEKSPTRVDADGPFGLETEIRKAVQHCCDANTIRVRLREEGGMITGAIEFVPLDASRAVEITHQVRDAALSVDWRLHSLAATPVSELHI